MSVIEDRDPAPELLCSDPEAFGRLFLKLQHRLFVAMLRMTGRRDEAEELVQEAFARAYAKRASFRGDSAFFTWLYRIAFNLAIQNSRRRAPASLTVRQDSGYEPCDHSPPPIDSLEREEERALLLAALAALAPDYRAALVLREIEGLDYQEISEVLGLTIGTVRSRLHRGRAQLRASLDRVVGQ